jgi:hypothetical protein
MNKLRQMRWSPQGAHRVLQVRAAVIDGLWLLKISSDLAQTLECATLALG